ncbi:hypothetical protein [Streptomyces sp. NPDC056069]|uniref:hypothetical protein n=1 Tax=Streptomyces sp. NPDC056069 TaxID=3345702 RepID=UPI0035DE592C
MAERMQRYGNGELDLDFRQIAITADDVRSGRLATHDVNTRDVNYARYREECLREGLDPTISVEVEALRPGLLRERLSEEIEGLVDDIRRWNIESRAEEADRELLRALQGVARRIVRGEPAVEDDRDE